MSGSHESYWRLLSALWREGTAFLVVEHDIEVNPEAIRQAAECDCDWGVSPYRGPGGDLLYGSLGCTRFSARLLATAPDAIEQVGGIDDAGPAIPLRDWRRIDSRLLGVLRQRGHEPHVHAEVLHHHRYHYGCACGEEHE